MLKITYIGHATLLIETAGTRLLTDPLLRNRVMHLRRHTGRVPEQLLQNLDAVLISHLHWDHFDLPSLKKIPGDPEFIVPFGGGKLLQEKGWEKIREVYLGDKINIGDLHVRAVYADHGRDLLTLGRKADCLGYMIEGDYSIYFPGDTDVFPGMTRLSNDLDVALVPVWGWGLTLGSGHMNPDRAATALQLLQPRVAIPIHWGTYFPLGFGRLSHRFLRRPPRLFKRRAERQAPQVNILHMEPGETVDLSTIMTGESIDQ
jgi:L-ascorbate metabolism protein UlaG (beta-lactamase superfamily)